jgi:hypothetical protein
LNAERVSASKTAWRTFIGKEFWKSCVGEKPGMKDRRKPLSFVVRYGENAATRKAYQKAWRYTEVLNYLIKLGIEPKAMAAYLAKSGQGINATYRKAMESNKTNARKKPRKADEKRSRKSVKPVRKQVQKTFARKSEQHRSSDGGGDTRTSDITALRGIKMWGRSEIVSRAFALQDNDEAVIRIRTARNNSGRRFIELVELLPASTAPQRERRKTATREREASRPSQRVARMRRRAVRW